MRDSPADAESITMSTTRVFRELIRACVDDERTLQHERKFVDARRGDALTRLAREREQFVADLERVGGCSGGQPTGSWVELLREAGRNLWVTAGGPNNGDAIETCRRSRARTEARYERAMERPLPEETRRILAEQRRRLHDEADELNQLRF